VWRSLKGSGYLGLLSATALCPIFFTPVDNSSQGSNFWEFCGCGLNYAPVEISGFPQIIAWDLILREVHISRAALQPC
jgi:hypothetical protein